MVNAPQALWYRKSSILCYLFPWPFGRHSLVRISVFLFCVLEFYSIKYSSLSKNSIFADFYPLEYQSIILVRSVRSTRSTVQRLRWNADSVDYRPLRRRFAAAATRFAVSVAGRCTGASATTSSQARPRNRHSRQRQFRRGPRHFSGSTGCIVPHVNS